MKRLLFGAAVLAACSTSAMAETTIGVSLAYFDDVWLTSLRQSMQEEADSRDINIQFLDAQGDIGRQLSNVQSLAAQDVDAIITFAVDSAATGMMTKAASENDIPLVYVNKEPVGNDLEQDNVVFVGANDVRAGRLQMERLAELMGGEGNVAIMVGELTSSSALDRVEGVKEILADYPDIEIVAEQSANFFRTQAMDLMTNWIAGGKQIDAVAANNDEMALGALVAMRQYGVSPDEVFVAGIDGTPAALDSIQRGELAVTVFQDAKGQAVASLNAALSLINGEPVDKRTMVPFKLVTPENLDNFLTE
tara:strand:- start:3426 stop:4346 length:921 start_codon:yes stop_codon:yes gene_type:complete